MLNITSRDNNKLKNARKVRDGREKHLIFIEGLRLVNEALKSELKLSELFISESFSAGEQCSEIITKLKESKIQIYLLPDKIFGSISDTKSSQGIVLISHQPISGKELLESRIKFTDSHFVLLHQINNPSNLGAILRTAEAAGIAGIITTKSSANVFSAKSIRGSMGASFRIPVWLNADFDEVIDWAKENDLITVCADINSKKTYSQIDWKQQHLIIFGSEAHGLTEVEREKIDEGIYIPMENNVESLNLGVACGIILFEARKNDRNLNSDHSIN